MNASFNGVPLANSREAAAFGGRPADPPKDSEGIDQSDSTGPGGG